jgi:hypothetical protein
MHLGGAVPFKPTMDIAHPPSVVIVIERAGFSFEIERLEAAYLDGREFDSPRFYLPAGDPFRMPPIHTHTLLGVTW